MNKYHTSVLLGETLEFLNIQKGKRYIDATLGGGGHTEVILERGGIVLGIDTDQDAIDYVSENFLAMRDPAQRDKLRIAKGNFKDIDQIAKQNGFTKVSGILFDLGVSGHQIDTAERGFSFQKEGPLDMRMDRDLNVQAKDLVNILTKGELYELINKLGEERFAHTIADRIIRSRRIKLVQTTTELRQIIESAIPAKAGRINSFARIFQALRIAINDELENLRVALPKSLALLEKDGRLAIITFHSLEDRIIKNEFKKWAEKDLGNILTKKPLIPNLTEMEKNCRSRSAKLRVFEKI